MKRLLVALILVAGMIGAGPAEDLFPHVDPIGKRIRIRGQAMTVVGVYGERNHLFGGLADDFIVLPYTTFRGQWGDETDQVILAIVPEDGYSLEDTSDDIAALMRMRHGLRPANEDDFALSSADAVEELIGKFTGPIGLVLAVIASIGLMVGGIGVMNIMVVSVTQRTHEIGVRKAVGARRQDIRLQFLIEAMALSGAGGVIGILVGIGLGWVLTAFYPAMPVDVSAVWVFLGFTISVGVGLFFGYYPADRAAQLDPIAALRHE